MSASIVLKRGEGKKVLFLGNEMVLKAVSQDSDGQFAFVEFTMAGGFGGPPPHIHHGHDETFYVVEGDLRFRIDDHEIEASAGSFVYVPRGVGHTFWNPTAKKAKLLAVFTPAGYEKYFEDVSQAFPAGAPPDPAQLTEIMAKYDTEPARPLPGR